VRYGGRFGEDGAWRVYGKYSDEPQTRRANGAGIGDAWNRTQVGFRADWGGAFTLQGDAYSADIDQLATTRKLHGFNLLGRWTKRMDDGADIRVQAYYDRVERDQPGAIREVLDTYDLEFQHGFLAGQSHRLLWGAGYLLAPDRVENLTPLLAFRPNNRTQKRANVFVQDEFALRPDLTLTAGIKLENNEYTGVESLPSLRLAWKAAAEHLVWGALSRAVRAPSRVDRELFSPANPPFVVIAGGPDFDSEIARTAELGYRGEVLSNLSFSITAFHREFDRLRSTDPSPAGPVFVNRIEGRSSGLEAWGTWSVSRTWRLNAGYTQQHQRRTLTSGSTDVAGLAALGNDPDYWWLLRSSWDIGSRTEFDVVARGSGALPNPAVPRYTAVDARLGWRLNRTTELSLAAQNLFDRSHPEWGVAAARPEFQRGIFAKILWRM
jgi:iron complex outermembrane receptor protein